MEGGGRPEGEKRTCTIFFKTRQVVQRPKEREGGVRERWRERDKFIREEWQDRERREGGRGEMESLAGFLCVHVSGNSGLMG